MAFTAVGVGAAANDGTGDPLRTAMQTINTNFSAEAVNLTATQTLTNKTLTGPILTDYARFPATQVPSGGANDLDDYEEGTFTPGVAFGGAAVGVTYTTQVGRYTKIGNRVIAQAYVIVSDNGSSTGVVTLTGLPFTADATANNYCAISIWINNTESITGQVLGYVALGTSTINVTQFVSNAIVALTEANVSNAANDTGIMFHVSYMI